MVCGVKGLSGLRRGGRTFVELGIQCQSDGYSVRNIFEVSFTVEVTVSLKAIFEGGLNFAPSEVRKNFESMGSSVHREEDRSASPSTQEHQNLEGKLNNRVK